METGKAIALGVVGLVVVGGIVFLATRSKAAAAPLPASPAGTTPAAPQTDPMLQEMMDKFAQVTGHPVPDWILSDAQKRLADGTVNPAHFVNGKATGGGALLSTLESEYQNDGNGKPYETQAVFDAWHGGLWDILRKYQRPFLLQGLTVQR